jgi:hypothetical protein
LAVDNSPEAVKAYELGRRYAAHGKASKVLCMNLTANRAIEDLAPADGAVVGFPCQPFSTAGPQAGVTDPRAKVLPAVLRMTVIHGWMFLILENVEGFEKHDGGVLMKWLHQEANCMGYHITLHRTDARHLVPQKRRRLFWTLIRCDLGGPLRQEIPFLQPPVTFAMARTLEFVDPASMLGDVLSISPADLAVYTDPMRFPYVGFQRMLGWGDVAPTVLSAYGTDLERFGKKSKLLSFMLKHQGEARWATPREICRIMGIPESFHLGTIDDFNCLVQGVEFWWRHLGASIVPAVLADLVGRTFNHLGWPVNVEQVTYMLKYSAMPVEPGSVCVCVCAAWHPPRRIALPCVA